jgi:hypothetical protein
MTDARYNQQTGHLPGVRQRPRRHGRLSAESARRSAAAARGAGAGGTGRVVRGGSALQQHGRRHLQGVSDPEVPQPHRDLPLRRARQRLSVAAGIAEGQSAAADAGGLAAFLGQQRGLQLVFLNGCSTQQQTQGLLDANVSAVISTSRAIDDRVATDFSCQFYQGWRAGRRFARPTTKPKLRCKRPKAATRGRCTSAMPTKRTRLEADRWPWNLYLREGSETPINGTCPRR